MSFLGMRVMSDRREMKGEDLSVIENDMKRDIESVPASINLYEEDECISDKDNVGLKKAEKFKPEDKKSIVAVPIDEEGTEKEIKYIAENVRTKRFCRMH